MNTVKLTFWGFTWWDQETHRQPEPVLCFHSWPQKRACCLSPAGWRRLGRCRWTQLSAWSPCSRPLHAHPFSLRLWCPRRRYLRQADLIKASKYWKKTKKHPGELQLKWSKFHLKVRQWGDTAVVAEPLTGGLFVWAVFMFAVTPPVTRLETIRGSTSIFSILISSSPGKEKCLISLWDRLWARSAKPRITPEEISTTSTTINTHTHTERTTTAAHVPSLTQSHGGHSGQNKQVPPDEACDTASEDGAHPLHRPA